MSGTCQVVARTPGVCWVVRSAYSTQPLMVTTGALASGTPASSSPSPEVVLTLCWARTIGEGQGGRSPGETTSLAPTSATHEALARPKGVTTLDWVSAAEELDGPAPAEHPTAALESTTRIARSR